MLQWHPVLLAAASADSDNDLMAALLIAIVSAAVGAIITLVFQQVTRSVARRTARKNPLNVYIETDPAAIWSGSPPWIGSSFLVPRNVDVPSRPPSGGCMTWRTWVHELGGVDEALTQVQVTLSARSSLTVVLHSLSIEVLDRQPSPAWRHIQCAAGGADIMPRRVEIRLDEFSQPVHWFVDDDGRTLRRPLTLSLSPTEAEILHLWAYAAIDRVEWQATLTLLADGALTTVYITDGGRPFVTANAKAALSHHVSADGSEWSPPIP